MPAMDDDEPKRRTNGSGRPSEEGDEHRIIRFPTLAERDRLRKEQIRRETEKSASPASDTPFFNAGKIPPFIGVMALIFVLVHGGTRIFFEEPEIYILYYSFGFVPQSFSNLVFLDNPGALISLFTFSFLHGSWSHLIFNTVMWLALGTFFEREFGSRATLIFFFLSAWAGVLIHFMVSPLSSAPVIGASATISGFFAVAFVLLYQRGMMGQFSRYGILPVIVFWLVFMIFMGMISGASIAWLAHIGGFFAGLFYLAWQQRRDLKFWRL